jgi:hypothetical protein
VLTTDSSYVLDASNGGHIEVQFGVDADEDALRTQRPSLWRWEPLPKC